MSQEATRYKLDIATYDAYMEQARKLIADVEIAKERLDELYKSMADDMRAPLPVVKRLVKKVVVGDDKIEEDAELTRLILAIENRRQFETERDEE